MPTILILSRLLLAAVFALAGIAKLADLPGSRRAVREFGLPPKLADVLGTLLPIAELVIAAALLPDATAWYGAVGALTLLLLFIVGISVNLARGRQPDCHCFGQLHSAPVSWKTLARNGLLALLAASVVWQARDNPGQGVFDWLATLTTTEIITLMVAVVALAIAAIEGWFLLHVLQQQGRLLLRIEALEAKSSGDSAPSHTPHSERNGAGLPVGTPAPAFQLPDLNGAVHALNSYKKPLVLLFSDPNCGTCVQLMPDVAFWQEEYADEVTIVVISRGTPESNRLKIEDYTLTNVLLQTDRDVSRLYDVFGTPGAVLINADGTIGSPLAVGAEAIESLVEDAIGDL